MSIKRTEQGYQCNNCDLLLRGKTLATMLSSHHCIEHTLTEEERANILALCLSEDKHTALRRAMTRMVDDEQWRFVHSG